MKFYRYIVCAFLFIGAAIAETININWINDGETYAQTTCEVGGDIILPSPPTKRGYTFKGWVTRYTRLEYIESTGEQWIDTGFKFTTTSKIELETLITNNTGFMGSNNTNTNRVRLGVSSGKLYNQLALDTNLFIEQDNQYHKYTTTATEVYIDDLQATITGFENQTMNYCIFGQNDARTSAISSYLAAKLKYLKIWDNNVPVRNFIPAKRNIDNVIGMYDTVSGQFFTNAGTGEFIAGSVAENQNFYE